MVTTTTPAMMTTNVDDKASGESARHFHITSRSGNDDNNNYRQQCILLSSVVSYFAQVHMAFSHRAQAHFMWRSMRATRSYHSNDCNDDGHTNVDEQAVRCNNQLQTST